MSRATFHRRFAAAGVLLTLVLPASAQTATPAPEDEAIVETLVVIGTHAPVSQPEMTSQVSVIDRSQIERLNRTSLQQLINGLTGLSINQQGGAGGITNLYVRGGEANFTVVLIDGVQVNNPADTRGGSFDFSTLDPSQVERIELIRGPQSAVYGADALSGVLNVVTRRPDGGSTAVSLEAGQDGYYRGHLLFSGDLGDAAGFSLNLGRSDSGELVEGSERVLNFANGSIDWQLTETGTLKAGFQLSNSERENFPEDSGGPELAVWDDLDQADADAISLHLGWSSQANERWRYQLQANWHNIESSEETPGIAPGFPVPPRSAEVQFDRYQFLFSNQLRFDGIRLGIGVDAEREEGDSRGEIDFGFPLDTSFSLSRDSFGGFVEAYLDLLDSLTVSASARYDDVEQAGSELTGRLGLLWLPGSGTTVRANWGQGFKPPSFFALAHPLVGNPNLDPERSESWELGLEQQLTDSWSVGVVYFDATYRDLIDFDDALFTNVNRDRVDAHGLELKAQAATDRLGEFRLHATWTRTDIEGLDQDLRGRPEWKWGAQWFYALNDRLDLTAEYLWVDEVTEASRHTGESVDYVLDAYNTFDLSLNWQLSESLLLRGAVENLLDESYQQAVGFPAPGRFFRLGLRWQPKRAR